MQQPEGAQVDLQRPKRCVDEIAALPTVGTTDWEIYVRANARRFCPETIVHVLRQANTIKNTSLLENLGRALTGLPDKDGLWCGGHCERIIMSVAIARRLSVDVQTLHEFRENCHLAMWKAILAGWDIKPYWELRFGLVLKNACIDEARKLIRRFARTTPLTNTIAEEHGVALLEEEFWQNLVQQAIEEAVRRLPARLDLVGFLAIVLEIPVDSKDGDSVAKILGITPRWAYELVSRAKALLLADPQLRKLVPPERL